MPFSADKLEEMGYYNGLRNIVEEMYAANNMTRVTLVAHSMGGPVSLYFLNNIVDQTWKDTYIHAYVPVAAAWDGGVAALENVISGVTDGTEFLIRSDLWDTVRDAIRSFQSVFGCFQVHWCLAMTLYLCELDQTNTRPMTLKLSFSASTSQMVTQCTPVLHHWLTVGVRPMCRHFATMACKGIVALQLASRMMHRISLTPPPPHAL